MCFWRGQFQHPFYYFRLHWSGRTSPEKTALGRRRVSSGNPCERDSDFPVFRVAKSYGSVHAGEAAEQPGAHSLASSQKPSRTEPGRTVVRDNWPGSGQGARARWIFWLTRPGAESAGCFGVVSGAPGAARPWRKRGQVCGGMHKIRERICPAAASRSGSSPGLVFHLLFSNGLY